MYINRITLLEWLHLCHRLIDSQKHVHNITKNHLHSNQSYTTPKLCTCYPQCCILSNSISTFLKCTAELKMLTYSYFIPLLVVYTCTVWSAKILVKQKWELVLQIAHRRLSISVCYLYYSTTYKLGLYMQMIVLQIGIPVSVLTVNSCPSLVHCNWWRVPTWIHKHAQQSYHDNYMNIWLA